MTIELSDDVATELTTRAAGRGITPSELVAELLRPPLVWPPNPPQTPEEWRARLREVATDCGVSLTDEQLSREQIYE